jgi:polyferredoxin
MRKFLIGLGIAVFLFALSGLSFLMGSDWGQGAAWATGIYGVLITFFLAMQVWGFVYSQVHYAENVEDAKFDLLEREGIFDSDDRKELA